MHIHDLLWAAHDLDYRCYAVFPLPQLARVTLVVLRVLARGTVQAEVIVGRDVPEPDPAPQYLWLLLHQGHMRLLQVPPFLRKPLDWLTELVMGTGTPLMATPSVGWALYLQSEDEQEPSRDPNVAATCRCCARENQNSLLQRKAGESPPPRGWAAAVAMALERGATEPQDLARAGRLAQTVELGTLGVPGSQLRLGLWGAPLADLAEETKAHSAIQLHDTVSELGALATQERILNSLKDPEGPNLLLIAPEATTFNPFMTANGGTRTPGSPQGSSKPLPREVKDNATAVFALEIFDAALRAKCFPILIHPAPDGRYPKLTAV